MIAALKRPPPWPPPGPARRCLLAAPATRQPWARQALLYSEDVGHGEGERPLRGHPAGRQGGAGPRQLALKDFACREPPGFRNVPEPWKKAGPRKLCTRRVGSLFPVLRWPYLRRVSPCARPASLRFGEPAALGWVRSPGLLAPVWPGERAARAGRRPRAQRRCKRQRPTLTRVYRRHI